MSQNSADNSPALKPDAVPAATAGDKTASQPADSPTSTAAQAAKAKDNLLADSLAAMPTTPAAKHADLGAAADSLEKHQVVQVASGWVDGLPCRGPEL